MCDMSAIFTELLSVDLFNFFYAAIPSEGLLTLPDLHTIVRNVWLCRYDSELEEERTSRRKGRPKSVLEQKIEEIKLREAGEYRTGLGTSSLFTSVGNMNRTDFVEVIDLTHPANVELFRKWDQKAAPYVQQLRFIRISSSDPDMCNVSRPGKHPSLKSTMTEASAARAMQEVAMDDDEAPLLLEPSGRFSSTIMTMDEAP